MAPIELRQFRGAQSLRRITSRVEKLCSTASLTRVSNNTPPRRQGRQENQNKI